MSLKAVLEKLPSSDFVRVNRSYIVATKKIRSIHNHRVNLKNLELPVGNNYADFISAWPK